MQESQVKSFAQLQAQFEAVRSNKAFELFVVGVIIVSAMLIGAKTYALSPLVEQTITVLDWLITGIFLIEITVRFLGEREKKNFFKSGWNIFDTTIVMVSLIPIEDSELAVIGRLVRIFRVLRMVSIIPELRMLLNSLLKALPQLGYVALLMFIIFYIYAAVGSTFFAEVNPVLWGDIANSMLTLFRIMTFEDWTDVMYETQVHFGFSWVYYLTFIFLTAFAFLNMIIGIVVTTVEQESRAEMQLELKDEIQEEADEIAALRVEIAEIKAMLQQGLVRKID